MMKLRKFRFLIVLMTLGAIGCCQSSDEKQTRPGKNANVGHEAALFSDMTEIDSRATTFGRILLDSNIGQDHRAKIVRSLRLLNHLNLDETSPAGIELKRLLGTSDLSGRTLTQWLEERMNVILDQSTYGSTSGTDYAVNWGILNQTKLDKINLKSGWSLAKSPNGSPRELGVVTFYPFLLNSDKRDIRKIEFSRAIYTLGVIFHEGRHSDGNIVNRTHRFSHSLCGSGPHQGNPLCDDYQNGPNAIQYAFLKAALESCKDCSNVGKDMLRIALLDFKSRVDHGRLLGDGDPFPERAN